MSMRAVCGWSASSGSCPSISSGRTATAACWAGWRPLALAAAGWTAAWRLGWASPVARWADVAALGGVGAACGLTAFVNPYGSELPRAWLAIMDSSELPRIIQEHSRMDLREPSSWPVVAFAAVYLFVLAGCTGKPRVAWLIPLFWLVQAYSRVRHAPLFAVTGLVAVAAMWPHTRWAAWLARNRPDFQTPLDPAGTSPLRFWPNVGPAAAAVLIALALQAAKVPLPLIGVGWARLDPAKWPVGADRHATGARADSPRSGTTCSTSTSTAASSSTTPPAIACSWTTAANSSATNGCWSFCAEGEKTEDAVAEWERRYGRFDFALTRAGSGFEAYFRRRPEWTCVKRTAAAAFYVRSKPPV